MSSVTKKPVRYFAKIVLFVICLLAGGWANAQNYDGISRRIDSLDKLKLPKSALAETEKLEQLARQQKNTAQIIKATLYRIRFQTAIGENAIPAVITALQRDITQAAYPEKPILQSLLGDMYWNYYQQNRYKLSQISRLEKPGADFTLWDISTLINEIDRQFSLSLQDAVREQRTPVSILDGVLQGDTASRYLRPTLYDLLVQRALDFYLIDENSLNRPKTLFTLTNPSLFAGSRTFAELKIDTTDTTSLLYKGMRYLQQATLFHLQRNEAAPLADLDMKRLTFLYAHTSINNKEQLYLNALAQIAGNQTLGNLKADALSLTGKYYQDIDSLAKAAEYFNEVIAAYPNSLGAKNAAGYLQNVKQKLLSIEIENVAVPGKPVLGLINYRNIKTAQLMLYKVSIAQYNQLTALSSNHNNGLDLQPSDAVLDYLKKQKPVQQNMLNLPNLHDYKQHRTEFMINPLQTGTYILVMRDTAAEGKNYLQVAKLKISNLGFATRVEPDGRIGLVVANRTTGKPMPGVQVNIDASKESNETDINGICVLKVNNNRYQVTLIAAGDTLLTEPRYTYGVTTKPNVKPVPHTLFFTDRELYRPGQTIYFKGLSLQTINGKSTVIANQNITLTVKQNFSKVIATIPFTTNAYGTFSGTFIIPQNMPGSVSFSINNQDSKYVQVAEYKRPGYQVTFLPVTQSYKPNDEVVLKGNVTAYAGYGISQARVALRVNRQVMVKDYRLNLKYRALQNNNSTSLLTDTVKTDDAGRFEIKFKAMADERYNPADIYYNFTVGADVTDGTGETQAANTHVTAAENNLTLITQFPQGSSTLDTSTHKIWLGNFSGVTQRGQIDLAVYALNQPAAPFKDRLWGILPDTYLLDSLTFKKNFPEYPYKNENEAAHWLVKNKVAGLTAASDSIHPLIFDAGLLKDQPSGTYKIMITGKNSKGDTASVTKYFKWTNYTLPNDNFSDDLIFVKRPDTPGVQSSYEYLAGTGKEGYMLVEKYNGDTIKTRQWVNFHEGKRVLVKIPVAANEQHLAMQFLTISNNRLHNIYYAPSPPVNTRLNVKLLTFRNLLQPGEKEQWKLQITGKNNEARQAEMVAGLYDASLDAIAGRDSWNENLLTSNNFLSPSREYFVWPNNNDFVAQARGVSLNNPFRAFYGITRPYEKLNMYNYKVENGIMIDARDQTTSTITLNARDVQMLQPVTIDQAMQTRIGGVATLNEVTLNGVMSIDNYGDSNSTSGASAASALNITPRTNFNETAFFYPQLHTDEQGQIQFDFTMPESLTKWHFKAFAHTMDMETGYIDREVFTQKKLSISANMSRFLRAGDTITISARLVNLTNADISGTVRLQLFNALNMQPVSLLVNGASALQKFTLKGGSNQPVSFRLVVPSGLDALTYRLSAEGGDFSDGEENTLPVLSNQLLVTESLPMMVRPGQTKTFSLNKLISQQSATLKSKTLTLEYSQNPAWYAIQAMPYLMELPDECSEQLFNRYYANSMAANLVNSMPQIKQVFNLWKNSNSTELLSALEKNQALKTTLIEETPWLQDARDESEQKKRIALLFDLNTMSNELEFNLDKLQKKQLPGGGFPWFAGTGADPYISTYILAGIGQLNKHDIVPATNPALKTITERLLQYAKSKLTGFTTGKIDVLNPQEIYTYYALSYFDNAVPDTLLRNYINRAAGQWQNKSVYEQGLIALTMLHNKKPEVAQMIIRSLKETAQRSDDMGMYWAKNQPGYYWYQSPVETQSLIIQLFGEVGDNQPDVDEMRIWLLRNKQTNNWKTTKATAAACYALLLHNNNMITASGTTAIKLGGKPLAALKPDVKADAGTGYLQTTWADKQIKPGLGKVEIKNNAASIGWGALHWQYLENIDKVTPSKTDIQLERKYFIEKQDKTGTVLTAVNAQHRPHTGDVLKVVMCLKAGRDFEYVQLKDMRPSGTEPVDVLSAYRYQGGLFYYQVTRDAATNFFISQLNKGSYVFEYLLRVTQPGSFSTGISTVQSVYAPEFNAHSKGERITFSPL